MQNLRTVVILVGVAAAIAGPVYAINAATTGVAQVSVVAAADRSHLYDGVPVTTKAGPETLPEGAFLFAPHDEVRLYSFPVSPTEDTRRLAFLSRGQYFIGGLAVGAAALLIAPVLGSVANGHAFAPNTPRRLAWLAGVVCVSGLAVAAVPVVASSLILEHLALGPGSGVLPPAFVLPLETLIAAAAVLVLAEVFRRGALIAADTEGMV